MYTMFNEPLCLEKIVAMVNESNKSSLNSLEIFDSLPSTNSFLLEKGKTQSVSGSVCIANIQTHGRGQRGRSWYSLHEGNIYCSILWNFSRLNLSALSLAVAVMLIEGLKKYGIEDDLTLKWPNDILLKSRKLSGILIESLPTCENQKPIVIGFGLNIFSPSAILPKAIGLHEIVSQPISRNLLIGLLLNELLENLPLFEKEGWAFFLERWRLNDYLKGKQITVCAGAKNFLGTMDGITDNGELILLKNDERKIFSSGDVSIAYDLP